MPKRQAMKQSKETPGQLTDRLLGQRVRARRMELKISQTELGARCGGVTFQQIQKYEKGINRIGSTRLMQIAQALDCGVDVFLGKSANGPSRFSDFLATKDGVDIMNAMLKLQQPQRRVVIELARKLT
jgi:transcriptional regulator with XRE-family HTH domain